MPPARVQQKILDAGTVTSANLTFDSNVAAGNLLLCATGSGGGTSQPTGVDDDLNPAWTIDKKQSLTVDSATCAISSRENSAAGTCTVTVTQASGTLRMWIGEYSGMATSGALDQTNGAELPAAFSVNSGNITTTQSDVLLIGAMRNAAPETISATDGTWTFLTGVPAGAGAHRMGVEEKIVSSTDTYSSQLIGTAFPERGQLIAAYKAGSAISTILTRIIPTIRAPMLG